MIKRIFFLRRFDRHLPECFLAVIVLALLAALSVGFSSQAAGIVDTTDQLYTYDEMMSELQQLANNHPDLIHVENAGVTKEGRNIPVVTFGNVNADRHIMIQATLHAREYMSSQLVMAMLEYYTDNFAIGSIEGVPYSTLFNEVNLIVVPMANPDGVCISEFGANAVQEESSRNYFMALAGAGANLVLIKANANGVDLNRNFPVGWGAAIRRSDVPSLENYPGPAAGSEIETRTLMNLAVRTKYNVYLNYHSMGNVIYYGSGNASAEANNASAALMRIAAGITGYTPMSEMTSPAYGSFADYVTTVLGRPSCTIEIGMENPVRIYEFPMIYNRNLPVWANVALAIHNGNFRT